MQLDERMVSGMAVVLTLSLPCHLKTTNESAKFYILKPFYFIFCESMWKDFYQKAQVSNLVFYAQSTTQKAQYRN